MWLSKRCFRAMMDKLEDLEKRTADLEGQVQGQQNVKIDVDAIHKCFSRHEARCGSGAKDVMS